MYQEKFEISALSKRANFQHNMLVFFFDYYIIKKYLVNGIYQALLPESRGVNLYHVALMLENYILLEPNVACEYIIKVNLLENLVKCCHNPKIHEILVSLVDPYLSKFNIFGEIQVKLWEWCYESNFFQRVINLIQNEKLEKMLEEESGTTEEILQKSKQFYSVEKTDMIMKQMVKKFGVFQNFVFGSKPTEKVPEEQKIAENTINNDNLNVLGVFKNTDWDGEYLKIDELNGKMPDIDNFRGFMENCRKAEIQKNIALTKRFVIFFHHTFLFEEEKKWLLNI